MTDKKINKDEKLQELLKYRDLVLATLDYYVDNKIAQIKTVDFDAAEHYKGLKIQAEEHYQKGRLTKLKQWFRDLTEMQIETLDLKFNKYLQDKTKQDIDIFTSFFQRVDKITAKGKITTQYQFYDIKMMLERLCQSQQVDNNKIEILNKLVSEYEQGNKRNPSQS